MLSGKPGNRRPDERYTRRKTPICSYCRKIRNDDGAWQQIDVYIRQHSDIDFSHGICPDCLATHFPGE